MSPQGHCLSDSELCGAIANKRMYEIRKRSVFSKQNAYSFTSRQYDFIVILLTLFRFLVSSSSVPPARYISLLRTRSSVLCAAADSSCSL